MHSATSTADITATRITLLRELWDGNRKKSSSIQVCILAAPPVQLHNSSFFQKGNNRRYFLETPLKTKQKWETLFSMASSAATDLFQRTQQSLSSASLSFLLYKVKQTII